MSRKRFASLCLAFALLVPAIFSFTAFPVHAQSSPDLIAYNHEVVFSPDEVMQSATVTITVTVHNNGTTTANQVEVEFYWDGAVFLGDVEIPFIGAGASQEASVSYAVSSFNLPGYHSVEAKVDPDNMIAETNETNNNAHSSVLVTQYINPNAGEESDDKSSITDETCFWAAIIGVVAALVILAVILVKRRGEEE